MQITIQEVMRQLGRTFPEYEFKFVNGSLYVNYVLVTNLEMSYPESYLDTVIDHVRQQMTKNPSVPVMHSLRVGSKSFDEVYDERNRIRLGIQKAIAECKLNDISKKILTMIHSEGGLDSTTVCQKLDISKATFYKYTSRLQKLGVMVKNSDKNQFWYSIHSNAVEILPLLEDTDGRRNNGKRQVSRESDRDS